MKIKRMSVSYGEQWFHIGVVWSRNKPQTKWDTWFTASYSISTVARAKHFRYRSSMIRLGSWWWILQGKFNTIKIGIDRLHSGGRHETNVVCQMLVGNSVVVTLTMVSCANACLGLNPSHRMVGKLGSFQVGAPESHQYVRR